jgi:hypothetical protein
LTLLVVKLIDVFNYKTVNSSSRIGYEINPNVTTKMSPNDTNSPFLIAIEITVESSSMTMAELRRVVYGWTVNSSMTYTYLQHCTPEHWAAAPGMFDKVL